MKRPINNIYGFRRPEARQGLRLWQKVLMGFGVLFIIAIIGVGLVGLKLLRSYSKQHDRIEQALFIDSLREARLEQERPVTMEDSLERIDLRNATVTGLRGYEGIQVPYESHRDTIVQLLGRADSTAPTSVGCDPYGTILHYYGSNIIDVDSSGKSVMRSIDLFANPEIKILAGQFILSRNTTLQGFARRFPFSADHKLPQGYYGLRPLRRASGELLHLTFDKQGRLAYVRYYLGC